MTTAVVPTTSFRVGQVTFFISDGRVAEELARGEPPLLRLGDDSRFLCRLPWIPRQSHRQRQLAGAAVLRRAERCELRATEIWQAKRDSNPQPAVLETAALPIELLACNAAKAEKAAPSRLIPWAYFVSR